MQSYQELLQTVLSKGEDHDDRTGTGTLSIFGYQWRHDLSEGFPLLTTKKVPLRWVAEELRWFLSGSTNEADLRAHKVDIWKEWATEEQCAKFGRHEGDLGPIYGSLWRNFDGTQLHKGVDQLANLVKGIQENPNSRRLIVTGWHAEDCNKVALPPCHTLWQVKCHRDNRLSLHLYARSIDSFLGLPFNIASYALLTHVLAVATGRQVGELIISFGDLHIYKNHIDQCQEQIGRDPRPLPTLTLNHGWFGCGLDAVLGWQWKDVKITNYDPHPKIEAEVSV